MLADLKIALVGATTASGQALRAVLAERDIPADRVRLLESPSEEAIISEYAGQPILIGTIEPDGVADRDLVFLCGSVADSARCLLWERKKGSILIDLSGSSSGRGDVPIVNVSVNPSKLSRDAKTVAAPHGISAAITTALGPLVGALSIESLSVVVLRPASDFGEPGIEELHRQTVSLLNFTDLPKRVFGRQLGFNLIAQSTLGSALDGMDLEARLAGEIDRIFDWSPRRTALRAVVVPVFHGTTALVHVRVGGGATVAAARKLLAESPGLALSAAGTAPLSPVEVVGQDQKLVASLVQDGVGEGGFWIWIAGADLAAQAAANAVEIAARLHSG